MTAKTAMSSATQSQTSQSRAMKGNACPSSTPAPSALTPPAIQTKPSRGKATTAAQVIAKNATK